MRINTLIFLVAVALAAFVIGSRDLAARQAPDPFIGRLMPCGHRYLGESRIVDGQTYYRCERGDLFPQRNTGGILDAAPTPRPPGPPRAGTE